MDSFSRVLKRLLLALPFWVVGGTLLQLAVTWLFAPSGVRLADLLPWAPLIVFCYGVVWLNHLLIWAMMFAIGANKDPYPLTPWQTVLSAGVGGLLMLGITVELFILGAPWFGVGSNANLFWGVVIALGCSAWAAGVRKPDSMAHSDERWYQSGWRTGMKRDSPLRSS